MVGAFLALLLLSGAHARTLNVNDESEFYSVYYSALPGDTVLVGCRMVQGVYLDSGGRAGNPISVVAKGEQIIGQFDANVNATIAAPHVVLSGFSLWSPLYIKSEYAVVDSISSSTSFVVLEGSNNVLRNVTVSELNIGGTYNTLKDSKIDFVGYSPTIQVTGFGNTIYNNTIKDGGKDNESVPIFYVKASNLNVAYNNINAGCHDTARTVIFHETIGSKTNTYMHNKCYWSNFYKYKGQILVEVTKDPGDDRICATNTVNTGLVTNIEMDRHC